MGERKERRLRREAMAAAEREKIAGEAAEGQATAEASERIDAQQASVEINAQQEPVEAAAQPETVEMDAQQAQSEADARENAPRQRPAEAGEAEMQDRGRRRRRRARINLSAAVVLMVIVLILGLIAGLFVGRSVGNRRAEEAEARLAEASAELEALRQAEAEAQSARSAEDDNAAALAALSGEDASPDGDSDMLLGAETFPQDGEGEEASWQDQEVVAEFAGGQLLSGEVLEEYNARLANYVFEGYSEADVSGTLLDEVMRDMVYERVLENHARELGAYDLTAADEQKIAAEAQRSYAEQVEICKSLVRADGMSEMQVEEAAQKYLLESEGVSLETVEAQLRSDWWMDKLFSAMTANVSVSAGDITTAYNEALADQRERFPANPEDFEAAKLSGEVIVYNLPDYREIRMIGLPFESVDALTAADDLALSMAGLDAQADAAQIAEIRAQIDALYAPLEELAGQLQGELASGTGFENLMERYPDSAETCYISADSALWVQTIIDAAMALENPGDTSAAIRTEDGVYLLQYVGDVPSGAVGMREVYDAISAQTQEAARTLAYEAQINAWIDEADAKYYPERLQ